MKTLVFQKAYRRLRASANAFLHWLERSIPPSDADVLADLAVPYGFTRKEARAIATDPAQHQRVEQEARQSAANGVRSVPTFVFAEDIVISGGRSEDEIAWCIEKVVGSLPQEQLAGG